MVLHCVSCITSNRHKAANIIADFSTIFWNQKQQLVFSIISSGWTREVKSRAPSQYPERRLFVRSRKVSKPRDWYFKLSYRFEIWQAHRQHCCRSACQISERSDNSKYKSRGFETLRDLTKRRLFGYWDGALNVLKDNHPKVWGGWWITWNVLCGGNYSSIN